MSLGDFKTPTTPKPQTIGLVFGGDGSGKTSFVTKFCPGPFALFGLDGRSQTAVKEAADEGVKVHFLELDPVNTNLGVGRDKKVESSCKKYVEKFMKNLELVVQDSLKPNGVKTICIDTGTELSEHVTLSVRGHLGIEKDYGKSKDMINRIWWRICNLGRMSNAHLIILAREKELWEDNKPSGVMSFVGNPIMNSTADWTANIKVISPKVNKKRKRISEVKFQLQMTKAGKNIGELGAIYDSDQWGELGPFAFICMTQYPNVDVDVWMR